MALSRGRDAGRLWHRRARVGRRRRYSRKPRAFRYSRVPTPVRAVCRALPGCRGAGASTRARWALPRADSALVSGADGTCCRYLYATRSAEDRSTPMPEETCPRFTALSQELLTAQHSSRCPATWKPSPSSASLRRSATHLEALRLLFLLFPLNKVLLNTPEQRAFEGVARSRYSACYTWSTSPSPRSPTVSDQPCQTP